MGNTNIKCGYYTIGSLDSNCKISCVNGYMSSSDQPIATCECENRKYLTYDITGLSEKDLTIETEFINKTQETYINVKGKKEFETLGYKKYFNIHTRIDTDIYSGYEYFVQDGLFILSLIEKINEKPSFECLNVKG